MEEERKYEINFLAKQENDWSGVLELLRGHGAKTEKQNPGSRVKLAYPIQKENFAFMGQIVFTVGPETIKLIQEDLKTKNLVLRSLISTYVIPERRPMPIRGRSLEAPAEENLASGEQKVLTNEPKVEKRPPVFEELSNEALEKKLKEILQE